MADDDTKTRQKRERERRLQQALRDNLRRRKTQARERTAPKAESDTVTADQANPSARKGGDS